MDTSMGAVFAWCGHPHAMRLEIMRSICLPWAQVVKTFFLCAVPHAYLLVVCSYSNLPLLLSLTSSPLPVSLSLCLSLVMAFDSDADFCKTAPPALSLTLPPFISSHHLSLFPLPPS